MIDRERLEKTPPGYEAIRVVGMGMSGTVYLAKDLRLDRVVALKVLRTQKGDQDLYPRFKREASLVARNPHPAIVPILDANLQHDPPFMVFQWMPGGDLETILNGEHCAASRVAAVGARLASALAYLHEQGILHRDMKVGNVLLDERGEVYLADLGLGRAADSSNITRTGHVVGTYAYMAPEIFESGHYSPRTDIFALGALLLELALGRRLAAPAVQVEKTQEALKQVADSDLRKLLRRCLRTDPGSRPGSAQELEGEFAALVALAPSDTAFPVPTPQTFSAPLSVSSEVALRLLHGDETGVIAGGARPAGKDRTPKGQAGASTGRSRRVWFVAALGVGVSLSVGGRLRASFSPGPVRRSPPLLSGDVEGWQTTPWIAAPARLPPGLRAEKAEIFVPGKKTQSLSGVTEVQDLLAVGERSLLLGGPEATGGYRLELRDLQDPSRIRWRHRHLPDPGGEVRRVSLVGDPEGVVAELELRATDGTVGTRTLLLWDAAGVRKLALRGPGLRVLAITRTRVIAAIDSREILVIERDSGATHGPFDLALPEGLEAGLQKDRVALRSPGRPAVLLP